MIRVWKGFHGQEVHDLIRLSLDRSDLLILCPPTLKNFQFLELLPAEEISFYGFSDSERIQILAQHKVGGAFGGQWPIKSGPRFGIFTSGTSSGSDRLVISSLDRFQASLSSIFDLFDRDQIENVFCYPYPFHIFGFALGYLASILYGWKLEVLEGEYWPSFHAQRNLQTNYKTLSLGTPAHFSDWLKYNEKKGEVSAASYSCIIGGAEVSPSLWQSIRTDLKISEPSIGYGATEASPGILHLPPGLAPLSQGEIGKPLTHVEVSVLEEGLRFTGPNLCDVYIENGSVTFPKEMVLNDRVQIRGDGIFLYQGRSDSILNRGGQKLSLNQIERRLAELNIEATGIALRDSRLGQELGLVVEVDLHHEDRRREITKQIHELLSVEFGVVFSVAHIRWVKNLPRNLNQKKSRGAAKRIFKAELPHQGPMLWVDELVSASAAHDEGRVRICLHEKSLALNEAVSELAFVEWIAQSFGLISLEGEEGLSEVPKMMLVGASGSWLSEDRPKALDKIVVEAKRTHQVGPFSIIEGKVFRENETAPLAEARLKVFAGLENQA